MHLWSRNDCIALCITYLQKVHHHPEPSPAHWFNVKEKQSLLCHSALLFFLIYQKQDDWIFWDIDKTRFSIFALEHYFVHPWALSADLHFPWQMALLLHVITLCCSDRQVLLLAPLFLLTCSPGWPRLPGSPWKSKSTKLALQGPNLFARMLSL